MLKFIQDNVGLFDFDIYEIFSKSLNPHKNKKLEKCRDCHVCGKQIARKYLLTLPCFDRHSCCCQCVVDILTKTGKNECPYCKNVIVELTPEQQTALDDIRFKCEIEIIENAIDWNENNESNEDDDSDEEQEPLQEQPHNQQQQAYTNSIHKDTCNETDDCQDDGCQSATAHPIDRLALFCLLATLAFLILVITSKIILSRIILQKQYASRLKMIILILIIIASGVIYLLTMSLLSLASKVILMLLIPILTIVVTVALLTVLSA